MSDEKSIDPLRAYKFHGLRFRNADGEPQTDCPFCEKSGKFFVAAVHKDHPDGRTSEPGMFLCQSCGLSGNTYTFLKSLNRASLETTTDDEYKELAAEWGLKVKTLKRHKLARSIINGQWLFPVFNMEDGISNLYSLRQLPDDNKPRLLGTPYCKRSLLGLDALDGFDLKNPDDDGRVLLLVEGHKDLLAMDQILHDAGRRDEYHLLGLPGATAFSTHHLGYVSGRDVVLLLDNDHDKIRNGVTVNAAKQGREKFLMLCDTAAKPPRSRQVLKWPQGYPDGYDVRDLLTKGVMSPKSNGKPVKVATV